MAAVQTRMEEVLQRLLPAPTFVPERLHRAMHYAVLGGGKRVRPLLSFAAGELTQADPARVEVVAAAVEMIHAYSLAHDDLPCMDNDTLRRGRPTCHVEFDEATALLAGDALQPLAFQLLAEHVVADDPGAQLEMLRILALASGSRGMAGGQAIDLASVGKTLSLPELERFWLLSTLSALKGNRTHSAEQLDIALRTVRNKINEYKAEGFAIPASQRGHEDE
jgi:farnesyl diphosphate synthase